ncbi:hypothetical protein ACIGO9_31520 [Nocardia asteroides]|uniref:hypothetical protein n=1 Tax=Nocardia asteroides TaxID=1824 RepID=UPI0037CABA83
MLNTTDTPASTAAAILIRTAALIILWASGHLYASGEQIVPSMSSTTSLGRRLMLKSAATIGLVETAAVRDGSIDTPNM